MYKTKDIDKLMRGIGDLSFKVNKEMLRWARLNFSEKYRLILYQGYLRRVKRIEHCIFRIYEICPLNAATIPKDQINDLEIYIQSISLNIKGSLDNLCELLVNTQDFGLKEKDCNLGYTKFDKRLPKNIREVLTKLKQIKPGLKNSWYNIFIKLRNENQHGISVYIPSCISKENQEKYNQAHERWSKDFNDEDWQKMESYEEFKPVAYYKHGLPSFVIHPQILADFNTLIFVADAFWEYFNSPELMLEHSEQLKKLRDDSSHNQSILFTVFQKIKLNFLSFFR